MLRVRLVLVSLILSFGWLFKLAVTYTPEQDAILRRIILGGVSGIPLLWALLMLAGLFWKAKQDTDGSICLAPGHPFLKLSDKFSQNFYQGEQFKPCPLYWKISLLSSVLYALCILMSVFLYLALVGPFFGKFGYLIVLVVIVLFVGANIMYDKSSDRMQDLVRSTGKITVVSILSTLVIVLATFEYLDYGLWGLLTQLAEILGIILLFSFTIAGFFGIITGIMRVVSWLTEKIRPTRVGQYMEGKTIKVKARWCPPVRECTENDFK